MITKQSSVTEVVDYLKPYNIQEQYLEILKDNEVDGFTFSGLTHGDIVQMFPGKIGLIRKITMIAEEFQASLNTNEKMGQDLTEKMAPNQVIMSEVCDSNVNSEIQPGPSRVSSTVAKELADSDSYAQQLLCTNCNVSFTTPHKTSSKVHKSTQEPPLSCSPVTSVDVENIPKNIQGTSPCSSSTSSKEAIKTEFQTGGILESLLFSNHIPSETEEPTNTDICESNLESVVYSDIATSGDNVNVNRSKEQQFLLPSLPNYSRFITVLLEKGEIFKEWDRFIEETAYHVIVEDNLMSRDAYAAYGKLMYEKYPCIKNKGTTPWTYFNKVLSQKIRNIRWKQKKKSSVVRAPRAKRRRHLPLNVEDKEGNASKTAADLELREVLSGEQSLWDTTRILRLQRETFGERRTWINSINDEDISSILHTYPFLKYRSFIESEFTQIMPLDEVNVEENWADILTYIESSLKNGDISNQEEEIAPSTIDEVVLLKRLQTKLKYEHRTKTFTDLITFIKDATFEKILNLNRDESPRLLVVLSRKNDSIENGYIVVDDAVVDCNSTKLCEMVVLLLKCYHVWGLSFPIQYQCLDFFHSYLFGEDYKSFLSVLNFHKYMEQFKLNMKFFHED